MSPRYRNLLLGYSSLDPFLRLLLTDQSENSQLVIALAGKGKSRSYAIPSLIRYDGSMFVIDLNDELTKATALWQAHVLGHIVFVADPMRTVDVRYLPKGEDGEPRYLNVNPIDFIRKSKNPSLTSFAIAEILIPVDALREKHWGEGAQGRFVATMLFVAFDPVIEEWGQPRNMATVWLILSDPKTEEAALLEMSQSDDQFVVDQAAAVLKAGNDNKEIAGIRNHIRVACGKLFSEPKILEFLSETNVSFLDLRYKKMTVYLVVPGNRVGVLAKLFGVIMKLALDDIEEDGRLPYDPNGPPMVVFQADEFPAMGRFKPFVDGIARYRGFGIKFQLFCQTLGQLADPELYGQGYRTICGNVGTIAFFGGTADYFTAQTISQLCGVETRIGTSTSGSGEVTNRGGWSFNTYGHPVMLPDEIMRYELPKQLILRAGKRPTEACLFAPGLTDFPDYWGFMESLKDGRPIEWAVRMADLMLEPTPANDNQKPPEQQAAGFFDRMFGKGR